MDLFIALIELIEAEGRQFRRVTIETGFALAVLLFAGLVAAAGFALIGWALYLYLLTVVNPAVAALIVGLLAVTSGGGVLWRIRRNYH